MDEPFSLTISDVIRIIATTFFAFGLMLLLYGVININSSEIIIGVVFMLISTIITIILKLMSTRDIAN